MTRRTWHSCQPVDLHSLARQWFVGNKRIELRKLAMELGISRATAYRWAGSAEQLVSKILASLMEDSFQRFAKQTTTTGSERVIDVLLGVMRDAYRFQPLRKFLERDAQLGLKMVAANDSPVRAMTVANLQQLIEEEIERGNVSISADAEMVAYGLTRIVESFMYADLIIGESPDFDDVSEILSLVFVKQS